MAIKNNKLHKVLDMVLLVTPLVLLSQLSGELAPNLPQVVGSALLGGLGGGLGFSLMWLTKDQTVSTKILIIAGLFILFTLAVYRLTQQTESARRNLLSCPICGYQAVPATGEECEVCFIPITETFKTEEGYESMEALILEEQLYFFGLEEEVDIYRPEIYQDEELLYSKDPNWKPSFTIEQYEAWLFELDSILNKLEIEVITE